MAENPWGTGYLDLRNISIPAAHFPQSVLFLYHVPGYLRHSILFSTGQVSLDFEEPS